MERLLDNQIVNATIGLTIATIDLSKATIGRSKNLLESSTKYVTNFPWYKNIYLVTATLYICWMIVGTTFYYFYDEWRIATAFYYTLEAGLSIGYCYPSEKTDASRLFTIVHVVLGSSVVVGSLAGLGNEVISEKKVSFSFLQVLHILIFYLGKDCRKRSRICLVIWRRDTKYFGKYVA